MNQPALELLLKTYAEQSDPPTLELLDINKKPVGALYLEHLRFKNFYISETNNSEKYYLVIDGVGIYFSFYRKLTG